MNKELIERIANTRKHRADWSDDANEEVHQVYVRMAEWFVEQVALELLGRWDGEGHPSDWLLNKK